MAVHAANAEEAVLEAAALQAVCELALHTNRQCPLTRRQVR